MTMITSANKSSITGRTRPIVGMLVVLLATIGLTILLTHLGAPPDPHILSLQQQVLDDPSHWESNILKPDDVFFDNPRYGFWDRDHHHFYGYPPPAGSDLSPFSFYDKDGNNVNILHDRMEKKRAGTLHPKKAGPRAPIEDIPAMGVDIPPGDPFFDNPRFGTWNKLHTIFSSYPPPPGRAEFHYYDKDGKDVTGLHTQMQKNQKKKNH